jgi:hypothetical protein
MSETRRTLARSHNRRVMVLLIGLLALIYLGLSLFPSRRAFLIWLCTVVILQVAATAYVIRLSKRQSISLGFVCTLRWVALRRS